MVHLRRTIWGVDFSGARQAGEKIWLARALFNDGTLHIEQLLRADELPDSGIERDTALAAVAQTLGADTNAIVGLDFPFSLPTESLGGASYTAFLKASAGFPDSDAFKTAFVDERRRADRESRTPFSPLNQRLYKQTFHGIRDVLRALVESGAQVLPMMEAKEDAVWLIEICPASTLKKENLYLSYKGKSVSQRVNRETIVEALQSRFGVKMDESMIERAITDTEGDSLDAILAAVGTLRGLQDPEALVPRDEIDAVEGRVYF